MNFPKINTLLACHNRSVDLKVPNIYQFDFTHSGITQRIKVIRGADSEVYLVDYFLIMRFNIRKEAHLTTIKNCLEELEITIDMLKKQGLKEWIK